MGNITEETKVQGWTSILVAEPDNSDYVFVCTTLKGGYQIQLAYCDSKNYSSKKWWNVDEDILENVICWKPISWPVPPGLHVMNEID